MYSDSINDLRNAFPTTLPPNGDYIVAGYFAPGDGGGGTFVWVPLSVTNPPLNDDNGIAIRLDPSSTFYAHGYFQRIYSGAINVRWFGAKGDGVTDDTAAVHAARDADAFANGGTLYFPKGEYPGAFVFDFVNFNTRNQINITGDGQGSVLQPNGTTNPHGGGKPVVTLGYRDWYWAWARFSNLKIVGTYKTQQKFSNGVNFANPSTNSIGGGC